MRIAVFGTGAVGGYFGGRLAEAGEDVTFIARGVTLRALKERGLRIESAKGNVVIHPAQATDDPALPVAGLALVSYPLHPPGRPDRLRTEHLPRLTVPCLFVHGTRDPFGSSAELEAATAQIPGPVTHVWIDGGRHELKGADRTVAEAVRDWLGGLSGAT